MAFATVADLEARAHRVEVLACAPYARARGGERLNGVVALGDGDFDVTREMELGRVNVARGGIERDAPRNPLAHRSHTRAQTSPFLQTHKSA